MKFANSSLMALIYVSVFSISLWAQPGPAHYTVLDGKIDTGEWENAQKFELVNGGNALLMHKDKVLYVAIVGTMPGWAHVYVGFEDSIAVLHASAALGRAGYVQAEDGTWSAKEKFRWKFRDAVYSEEVAYKQDQHTAAHGWVGNNSEMASGKVFEFQLDMTVLPEDKLRLAFVHITASKPPAYFPEKLGDGALNKTLLFGDVPDKINFDTDTWYLLDLENKDE